MNVDITTTTDHSAEADSPSPLPERKEAEDIAYDVKRVLVECNKVLTTNDSKEYVEKLERWLETYRRGLSAASKISENGIDLLTHAHDQLRFSLDEILRLENEGGSTPSRKGDVSDHLEKALKDINRLMPMIEESFSPRPNENIETVV